MVEVVCEEERVGEIFCEGVKKVVDVLGDIGGDEGFGGLVYEYDVRDRFEGGDVGDESLDNDECEEGKKEFVGGDIVELE